MAGKLEVRKILYLQASPEKVWKALTRPVCTAKYYYGLKLRSPVRKGSRFCYEGRAQGKPHEFIRGKVLQVRPKEKLVTSFRFADLREPSTRVTYELRRLGKTTKLAFVHAGFKRRNTTFDRVTGGWEWILSGLKTYVETGQTLKA